MRTAERVVFNTIVLYVKIIASMIIALVTVPLVLHALGASDYGLYNLVAGVVAILSFLNNSMTVSSQRYMSVAMGEENERKVNIIYNTSFALHLTLGILIVLAFEIIGLFAIEKLNIEPDRMCCAKIIFQFLILSTFSKIVSVPFDALMNAKEDMLPFSVIMLFDSVLMLIVAFTIKYFTGDKLIYYGFCVAGIAVLTFLMKYGWCRYSYKEYRIKLTRYKGQLQTKAMLGFTGWNLFGGLAMMGRNQGVAVIINLFLGTVANAAYGVANQINGALGHFSSTFQKAINPQLMKSEGMQNRVRMLRLSFVSSKFSVLALSLFAVPLIIEMEEVLNIWLKNDIPPFTLRLSQLILILSIAYQYSVGIMSAIQANGNIRNYQITMGLILLLNVPIAYFMLKLGYPIYYTTAAFVVLEFISLMIRLYMAKHLTGMEIQDFVLQVIKPTAIIIAVPMGVALLLHYLLPISFLRLVVVSGVYCVIYMILMWKVALEESQRASIYAKIKSLH